MCGCLLLGRIFRRGGLQLRDLRGVFLLGGGQGLYIVLLRCRKPCAGLFRRREFRLRLFEFLGDLGLLFSEFRQAGDLGLHFLLFRRLFDHSAEGVGRHIDRIGGFIIGEAEARDGLV